MDRWNWNPSSQINAKKIRQWIPENGSWRAGADDRVTIHPPSGGPIVGRAWTATVSTANSDGIYEYLTTCPPPSLFPAFCCRSLSSSVPSLWSRLSLSLSKAVHTDFVSKDNTEICSTDHHCLWWLNRVDAPVKTKGPHQRYLYVRRCSRSVFSVFLEGSTWDLGVL